jgi:hypothetical protein
MSLKLTRCGKSMRSVAKRRRYWVRSTLLDVINARCFRTKDWTSRKGRHHSGVPFSTAKLGALLRNVLYKGSICYKGTLYPGEQPAIVDLQLWERVNKKFVGRKNEGVRLKHQELLTRLLGCGRCGLPMTSASTRKQGRLYRYYACQGKGRLRCRRNRVGVKDLDEALTRRLEPTLGNQPNGVMIQQALERVIYDGVARQVSVTLRDGARFEFTLTESNRVGARATRLPETGRVPRVSRLMALAVKLERLTKEGTFQNYAEIARLGQISRARLSYILGLLNLTPAIQETLLFLPKTLAGQDRLTERSLRDIAKVVDWQEQQRLF